MFSRKIKFCSFRSNIPGFIPAICLSEIVYGRFHVFSLLVIANLRNAIFPLRPLGIDQVFRFGPGKPHILELLGCTGQQVVGNAASTAHCAARKAAHNKGIQRVFPHVHPGPLLRFLPAHALAHVLLYCLVPRGFRAGDHLVINGLRHVFRCFFRAFREKASCYLAQKLGSGLLAACKRRPDFIQADFLKCRRHHCAGSPKGQSLPVSQPAASSVGVPAGTTHKAHVRRACSGKIHICQYGRGHVRDCVSSLS